MVADQHPPHRRATGPRDRDREGARVHPPAHRRNPGARGPRGGGDRGGALAAVAAPPRVAETGMRRRRRASPGFVGAVVGVAAVAVFAAFATVGLPIDSRYAFLAAAILCIFCAAAVCGWMLLPRGDPAAALVGGRGGARGGGAGGVDPLQYRTDHHELQALARQQRSRTTWRARGRRGDGTPSASRRGDQPRPDPPARAAARDPPRGGRERPGAHDLPRHLSWSPRTKKCGRTTSSTPTTPRNIKASGPRLGGRPTRRFRRRARAPRGWCSALRAPADRRGGWVVPRGRAPTGLLEGWTVHPPSKLHPGRRNAARDSGSGAPAAPAGDRLRLLPSGPDLVHEPTPRGTRAIDAPSGGATGTKHPSGGNSAPLERIAGAGHRYLPA